MSKHLARLYGSVLAVALIASPAAPASAQIIIGGQPVTISPGETAPAQLTFPLNTDSADYAPINVAAPAFTSGSTADADIAARIADVVRADLVSTGLFTAPEAAAIAAFRADIGALPVWSEWSGASVGAVLFGKVETGADSSLSVQFRLYDVAANKQVIGTQYRMPADQWRRAAHKVADDVMVALVGGKGGFDSRIVYAAESGGKTRLGIADGDGANAGNVIESVTGLEAPRFSPTTQTIVYAADAPVPGKPTQAQRTTITYDMQSGQRAPLSTGAQPNGDARYSADGLSLIYSRKQGANTDIYLMALSTRKETRLTDDKAADKQPALSPDGKLFAFVSDRGGEPQAYIARVDGAPTPCADGTEAKACRLSTVPGEHGMPVWSPRGDWLAFSARTGQQSAIHLVRADGSAARQLTTPGANVLDMHPSWSPEGRRLAFYRVTGSRSQLAVTSLKGGEPVLFAIEGDVLEPDWGPKLP